MLKKLKLNKKNLPHKPVIVVKDGDSLVKESYNRLQDNVLYFCDGGKRKVIQVESAISGEGKSTCVCNLAVSLVNSGKKVVVVDLDFRKPKIHKGFGIPNINGIVEYMLDKCDYLGLVKSTKYGVDIVNRGKNALNPAMIFTSDKFKELIEKLKGAYDVVLFDCPPVLQISDYIHIGRLSDGILYIVSCNHVSKAQVKEAVSLLRRNDLTIIGSVMTFVDPKDSGGSDYYYKTYKAYGAYTSDNQ